jgi:hypothetical protein
VSGGTGWCQAVLASESRYWLVESGETGNVGYNPCSSVQDCNSDRRSEGRQNLPAVGIDPIKFQQQMISMMALLTQSIASNRASLAKPPRIPEPKVKDPDIFDGSTSKVNSFITKCKLVFALQLLRFVRPWTRVNCMLSLLQGTALNAIQPLLESPITPYVLLTPEAFIDYLQINYGNPDENL